MTRRVRLALVVLLVAASPAFAWKPKTHVYLAEQAMADALDDGKVTLFEIDPATNTLKRDPRGNPVKLGDYAVDPRILEALRKHPKQYRAGVLGPDAFPDLLTGQQIIHPAGKVTPGESGVDLNPNGPGPDAWMRHLWHAAYVQPGPDANPATRAFVAGFLAHAAGDLYGHTCVNYYTGDAFHFAPNPLNAVRHVVVEGYFDKHVPAPTYETSLADGVDGFIHRQMILGRPGTPVMSLLTGDNVKTTLAARYSDLRNRLARDIQAGRDPQLLVRYKTAWIADIDKGLEKLPEVSHQLALALMFNPTGKADTAKAKMILDDYVKKHLLSMSGLPDAVGATAVLFGQVVDALGTPELKTLVQAIQRDALNYVTRELTGMSVDDLTKALAADATDFDRWMDQPPLEGGQRTTRREFEANELKLTPPAQWIDYRRVPPAYNTVAMIKLSLLGKDEVNRLMADLGSRERLAEDNAMLGFAATLDGSNQWQVNPQKMVVARHPAGYARVFLKQNGQDRAAVRPVAAKIDYELTIKTGDKLLAGTDAGVFVTLVGKAGKTDERKLNDLIEGNAFERNQTDRCTLKGLPDVGELESVVVRSDGRNPAAGWYLSHVVVKPANRPAVRFDCEAWLEDDQLTKTLKR